MSGTDSWEAVDAYIGATVVRPDPALQEATEAADRAGLPRIAVSPAQGKLLRLLALSIGARRVLEIGTLGGYSTIWLAGAVGPDGQVVTLERDPRHADVARANLTRAGFGDRVDIVLGAALETLEGVEGPFDLSFIDADKANIPAYFDRVVALSRPGAVIVVDNVVRNGALVDPANTAPDTEGVRALHEMIAGRDDVEATTVQTVGVKGYDGFTFAVVR